MNITRERFVVMRNNRSEVWCGLSKHFYFKPISEIKDTSVKTYRSQAQAEAGCSSWDRNFEVVPATETLVIGPKTNYDNIRAMSVEELAKFLLSCDEGNFVSVVCEEDICKECKPEIWHCSGNCLPAVMKWLQQSAENDDTDG